MSIADELKKGAFVNFIGVVGKMAAPTFLIVVNRLYGPDIFGIYITANIAIEIIIAFLTSGFKDGALIFVARYADNSNDRKLLYTSLTNSFLWSVGLSLLVLAFGAFFGNSLINWVYEDSFGDKLIIIAQIMVISIPFMAFERIVLAATQGLKIMKYDALNNGWLRPIALLIFSIIYWLNEPTLISLGLAYLSTQILLFIVSIYIFTKEFKWAHLFKSFKKFSINRELIDFAIPQSINMTLNRFITGIDVLMLPAFGFSATIVGFYGAGTMLVREIRSVKMVFSTAFSPHIVRLYKLKSYKQLSYHFSKTSAWIASITIPVLFIVAIFKDPLMAFIHPEYAGNTQFIYYLLPIPYFFCSFSLAGNIVAMTGHSKLNLLNSIIVAATNTLLNFILIPKFGIIGAALASAIAMFILNSCELIEARLVASAKLYLKHITRPHLSGFIASILLSIVLSMNIDLIDSLIGKVLLATSIIIIYGIGLGTKSITKIIAKLS